ncbi:low molecular weight protein tyrosine phosphatase family protein [Mucilaginibacter gilvus]|uniref:Protein tyrosine phosphatase n=1 Tax=Mucilaginibacter gilvus TaxID=2305909 RepID=A0A3S3Z3T0_9SPHI|nr:protein tyrosine phosphatase [Mucilaginibacter gilvus]RWY52453.1 protein tyrosine phosphatase [Mucilaginibacter gilvus]
MPNLLFICSKNQWRSPTAELLFKNHALHQARSAGTGDKARVKLNQKMLDWADVIFVMEYRHRDIVKQNFCLNGSAIVVLDVEDLYQFNDPELVEILQNSLAAYLST